MEPVTPIETLCRIILRAREYEAQVPTDYDGGEAAEIIECVVSGHDEDSELLTPRSLNSRRKYSD